VILHELGHSLVAQLFGVKVQDITLWPIGGVARMGQIPRQPYQEFLMTAAGPATNLLLAGILAGVIALIIGPRRLLMVAVSPWLMEVTMTRMDAVSLVIWLTFNNIALALFNLIPAFPMDGGRMLRSFLATFLSHRRATEVASILGQMIAALMGVLGLLSGQFMLALAGLFVFMAAMSERHQVVLSANFRGLRVRQVMQPLGVRLNPLETLGEVAGRVAASPQAVYWVVEAGRLVGLLPRSAFLAALRKAGPAARVAQHIRRDVVQLRPDEPLEQAREHLGANAAAVVVEEGQVIGSISVVDLLRLAELLAAHPEALARDVSF
jgi:stage IV sporulation protein FB